MFQRDFSFVHKYFTGEKQESLVFLIIGVAAIILSALFFFLNKSHPAFFKGSAVSLLVVGIILAAVGFSVYQRSDRQRNDVAYQMGIDPGFVKQQEMPRMQKVMHNFLIYRYVEIALILVGAAFFLYFRNNLQQQFIAGLSITLAILALVTLVADYFAHQRGALYIKELENFLTPKN